MELIEIIEMPVITKDMLKNVFNGIDVQLLAAPKPGYCYQINDTGEIILKPVCELTYTRIEKFKYPFTRREFEVMIEDYEKEIKCDNLDKSQIKFLQSIINTAKNNIENGFFSED